MLLNEGAGLQRIKIRMKSKIRKMSKSKVKIKSRIDGAAPRARLELSLGLA